MTRNNEDNDMRAWWRLSAVRPTQYQCCGREHLWVVVDLKRCYRNIQNEWMNEYEKRIHGKAIDDHSDDDDDDDDDYSDYH